MILHDYYRSSSAFCVRIALNLKGINYETRIHNLDEQANRSIEYLKINQLGLLPALEDEDDYLFQSGAILEYLDEKFGPPNLLPLDPAGKARVRGLFHHVACDIHPLTTRRVTAYLQRNFNASQEDILAWKHAWMREGLFRLEAALACHSGTGRFCHGIEPTLADIALVPQVYSALTLGLRLDDMPTVFKIYMKCCELPAFQKARPDNCSSSPKRASATS